VTSHGKCREVGIKMQGDVFRTDLFILPLVGCDIVLGILSQKLRSCVLQGLQQRPSVSLEEGESLKRSRKENK